jgi:hypothetical protein
MLGQWLRRRGIELDSRVKPGYDAYWKGSA